MFNALCRGAIKHSGYLAVSFYVYFILSQLQNYLANTLAIGNLQIIRLVRLKPTNSTKHKNHPIKQHAITKTTLMKKRITPLLVLLCLAFNGMAQTHSQTGLTSAPKQSRSFQEILDYEAAHPADATPIRKKPKNPSFYPSWPLDASRTLSHDAYRPTPTTPTLRETSPAPTLDFMALEDNGKSIPPDVNGAVGPHHVMTTLNTEVRIQDREGHTLSTSSLGAFWHGMPGSGGTFDPKVMYNPAAGRWIVVTPSSSDVTASRILVAVSTTDDPTGNWNMYAIDSDENNLNWFDYPSVGFNNKWLVFSGNMFGNNFYTTVFALDINDLNNGAETVNYSRLVVHNAFTLVPAKTYDDEPNIYLLAAANDQLAGNGYLQLFELAGEAGNETLTQMGNITSDNNWQGWGGNIGPQAGSDEGLNLIDHRMLDVICRNGKIWGVHNIYLPANNPQRSAIQWWQIDTDGLLEQKGRIEDPTNEMWYAYPSMAVNAFDDVMIGFSVLSENQYASAGYAIRQANDPLNNMREVYQYKDGLAPYYKTFGGSRNRWGDYTATYVDPIEDLDFWTIQQYAELPSGNTDHWGTWWAKVEMQTAPKAAFETATPLLPITGQVNFTDRSSYRPTEWQWTFEGGQPATSQEQHPVNISYAQAGTYDVQLIVVNELGRDTLKMEDYIQVSTNLLPAVQFMANDTILCASDTLYLTDQTLYQPNAWEWDITPNHYQFIEGTTAQSQNPVLLLQQNGPYSIHLKATNINGSNQSTEAQTIFSGGLLQPFLEDFEHFHVNSTYWSIENPDDKNTWKPVAIQNNNTAIQMDFLNYIGFGRRDFLISPAFNLQSMNSAWLSFDHAYAQRAANHSDSLIVSISTDCGSSWERIGTYSDDGSGNFATVDPMTSPFVPTLAAHWCGETSGTPCIRINLANWLGQTGVRFRFETVNGYGNALFLDNIRIESDFNVHQPVLHQNLFELYPNPAHSQTEVVMNSDQPLSVKLLNAQGQQIGSQRLLQQAGQRYTFNLHGLRPGLYFLYGETQNRKQVIKLVIE